MRGDEGRHNNIESTSNSSLSIEYRYHRIASNVRVIHVTQSIYTFRFKVQSSSPYNDLQGVQVQCPHRQPREGPGIPWRSGIPSNTSQLISGVRSLSYASSSPGSCYRLVVFRCNLGGQLLVEDSSCGSFFLRLRRLGKWNFRVLSRAPSPLIICTSFLLLAVAQGKDLVPVRKARGLKTLMSKRTLCLSMFQKLSAFMSSLAFSSELAILWSILSPPSGCSTGSTPTLL